MNKEQAAQYLGVSVRALERYVQQSKISVRYEKGKTRSTANFDEAELEAFKQELNQPSYKPAVEGRQNTTSTPKTEPRQKATEDQGASNELTLYNQEQLAEFDEISPIDGLAIIERLVGLLDNRRVPIADKILLTLAEAQDLTGLSREYLRSAISEGKLKANKIGNCWRLKRGDLDEYVAQLF